MDKIENGIDDCIDRLSEPGHSYAAQAIMTTDTVPKERAIDYEIGGRAVTLGGMAKGSGMISPNMATMISVITTDADIPHELLKPLTKEIVEISFNQIGVDNDMSTSDTVLVFANGMSGTPEIQADSPEYEKFKEALTTICQELAKDIVKDGEGATKFVEISVTGAETDEDAKTITRAIGNSMVCKTAFFGQDPNWGRFACAAGYSGIQFNPEELSVALDSIVLYQNGQVAQYKEEDAAAIMLQPEFTTHISVGKGSGQAVFWTSDLSHDYVSINADYRS
jgi:glutamate N-acetyltransferase/amino-acid N-acetyltransferase